MTNDAQAHQLERLIRELCYDLQPGSERAADVRASLAARLDAIRHELPRQHVLRLETLIDRLTR